MRILLSKALPPFSRFYQILKKYLLENITTFYKTTNLKSIIFIGYENWKPTLDLIEPSDSGINQTKNIFQACLKDSMAFL